jgi:hypothetical protein
MESETYDFEKHTGFTKPVWGIEDIEVEDE